MVLFLLWLCRGNCPHLRPSLALCYGDYSGFMLKDQDPEGDPQYHLLAPLFRPGVQGLHSNDLRGPSAAAPRPAGLSGHHEHEIWTQTCRLEADKRHLGHIRLLWCCYLSIRCSAVEHRGLISAGASGDLGDRGVSRGRVLSQGAQLGSAEAWSRPQRRAGFGPSQHRRIGRKFTFAYGIKA